jgi:hypothetical protein
MRMWRKILRLRCMIRLSGKMVGIGLTMEGMEQNPALYQLDAGECMAG